MEAPGQLALDGCEYLAGDLMYFCTVRAGYTGVQWFRAEFRDGAWRDWRFAGDELKQDRYEVGELHMSADGQEMFFHSRRAGGYGGLDLWVAPKTSDGWGEPINLGRLVNTSADEGWPFVSPDGQELWYNGQSKQGRPGPAIFRAPRQPDGSWGHPEEIVSTFAGEPSMSNDGRTLYFVHHYYSKDLTTILEGDIYVSVRTK